MCTFAPPQHVRRISTPDGTVLLDIDHGRFYGLNPVGSLVWEALVAGQSIEQVAGGLAARCAIPRDRIREDVIELLGRLREHGLLDPTCEADT